MAYRIFTPAEAEEILRASEDEPTTHRGGQPGHARAKHFLLSNQAILDRYELLGRQEQERRRRRRAEDPGWRPGGPIFIMVTAFVELSDMIEMAALTLNSPQGQAGVTALFVGPDAAQGARLEFEFAAPRDIRVRFAQGPEVVRVMPVRQLTLVVDRVDARPHCLHIQTFYGGAIAGAARNWAKLHAPNGQELLGFTGLP